MKRMLLIAVTTAILGLGGLLTSAAEAGNPICVPGGFGYSNYGGGYAGYAGRGGGGAYFSNVRPYYSGYRGLGTYPYSTYGYGFGNNCNCNPGFGNGGVTSFYLGQPGFGFYFGR